MNEIWYLQNNRRNTIKFNLIKRNIAYKNRVEFISFKYFFFLQMKDGKIDLEGLKSRFEYDFKDNTIKGIMSKITLNCMEKESK